MLSWSCSNYKCLFLVYTTLILLFDILPEPSLAATERCHPNEKKALLKIKEAFNASTLHRSWSPNTDCCEWHGIYCEPTNHNVYTLYISGDDFPGTIADAIGDLPYLSSITLTNLTSLSGPIPPSITKLRNLYVLDISKCNLKGTIPGYLSKFKNLVSLDLSYNKLTGHIPSSLSNIPTLGSIRLDGNQLTGSIPESLVKLKENNLYISLSHNKLSGEIPASFRDIKFGRIDFSYNKLRGDISMLFGRKKTTNVINLARNKFYMSASKLQLNPLLTDLDISRNNIYGRLPKDMITLDWVSLNVSYNRLCGPIPQGGYLQTKFDYSSFFHNRCLCGAPLTVACK